MTTGFINTMLIAFQTGSFQRVLSALPVHNMFTGY
jgi:hypothetical protein